MSFGSQLNNMPQGAFDSRMPKGSRGGGPNDNIPKGYRAGQMQQFDPQQMELYQQMFGNVGPDSYLSKLAGGDQSMFDEMERPALKQFGELQGGMASKFSGMGMGGRHSSGFGNSMNAAASDFAQNLQSQRLGLRNQALKDLMGMSNTLLDQRPYDKFMTKNPAKEKKGGWGGAASGAASGASMGAMAGPWGALAGGIAGGAMGYFSK